MLSYADFSAAPAPRRRESLPFTLRLVRDTANLQRAVSLRQQAYARHVPEFAAQLSMPEPADLHGDAVVMLAESKLDGAPLSTMRIQTNLSGPLALEASMPLPAKFRGLRLAEATRLGVLGTRDGQLAKTLMFKAYFLLCMAWRIDWMVITARKPLDRQYEALLFKDVVAGAGYIPMKHVGGLPHRVLALEVNNVEPSWRQAHHPLVHFFFDTEHPDLQLPVSGPLNASQSVNVDVMTDASRAPHDR